MKAFKKALCLVLALLTIGCLCACGGNSGNPNNNGGGNNSGDPNEQAVRTEVESLAKLEYYGRNFDGSDMVSSTAAITKVEKISDTRYTVSGTMEMKDASGSKWTNTFSVNVDFSSDDKVWYGNVFNYTNDDWTKG